MKRTILVLTVLALLSAGCGSDKTGATSPGVESLTLTPTEWPTRIDVGQTVVLQTGVTDASGSPVSGISLSYTSSDTTVLRVSQDNVGDVSMTAVGPGTSEVTVALAPSESGTASAAAVSVKVTSDLAGVEVEGDGEPLVLASGDTAVMQARGLSVRGDTLLAGGLEWSVAGTGVARVTPYAGGDSAKVTALKAGEDTVKVMAALCVPGCGAWRVVDVVPGPATQLVFTVQPRRGSTGMALSPPVEVSEEDAYGNVATGATDSVTVVLGANPSGATLSGRTTQVPSGGVATFAGLKVNEAGDGYTLVARASALASATSNPFTIGVGPVAYVANNGSDNVSVIDVTSGKVTKTIGVGAHPRSVAITPDGTTAYVTDFASDDVSVIDVASGTVMKTIGVGTYPWGVAVTPDGSTAYVVNSGKDNDISAIDVASETVRDTIAVGWDPLDVAIRADGSTAYVTNSGSGTISVVDVASGTVTDSVKAGTYPLGVAITPDGGTAFVTNKETGEVSVIDVASETVTKTIAVGTHPFGVAITPDGGTAFVTNELSGTVSVIDVGSGTVTKTIAVGTYPLGVAITPDGGTAYVTNEKSGNVSVIDIASGTVTNTIAVGTHPWGLAIR